jgi:hypothetical protein
VVRNPSIRYDAIQACSIAFNDWEPDKFHSHILRIYRVVVTKVKDELSLLFGKLVIVNQHIFCCQEVNGGLAIGRLRISGSGQVQTGCYKQAGN